VRLKAAHPRPVAYNGVAVSRARSSGRPLEASGCRPDLPTDLAVWRHIWQSNFRERSPYALPTHSNLQSPLVEMLAHRAHQLNRRWWQGLTSPASGGPDAD